METSIDRSGERLTPQARERVERELLALSPDELRPIRINIEVALGAVWRILPGLAAVREELVADLPRADWSLLDRLPAYAIILNEAEQYLRSLPAAIQQFPVSAPEVRGIRDRLLDQADALDALGLLDEAQVRKLRRDRSLPSVAIDVQLLTTVLDRGWRQFGSRPLAVARDLALAKNIQQRLAITVNGSAFFTQAHHEASQRRLRAYTLFIRTYDDLTTAVTYARYRQGDAKRLVPALYPERRPARRRAS